MMTKQDNLLQNCSLSWTNAAKLSPAFFAKAISGSRFKTPPHIRAIDAELLKIATGENKRLIVNMPPRHGKSELISKYFPAWFLGVYPSKRIILSSYEATFAASWGAKIRDILTEHGAKYFNAKVSKNNRSSEKMGLNGGGELYCVGAGGAITGKGADLLIIDDPIKNDAEANSPTYRDKTYEWFQSTAYTRLEPNGAIIIVMTRWHDDDLCGRLLKRSANEWKTLKLPAIAESEDMIGREVGEPLWEERFSLDDLLDIKNVIGPYWFSSLYQQSPSLANSGIFKKENFRYFEMKESHLFIDSDSPRAVSLATCKIFAVVDLAISLKSTADYTVGLVFATDNAGNIYILDVKRTRINGAEHLNFIKQIFVEWRPILIGIETAQYQLALLQNALKEGLPAKELKPDKDKISRALPIAARLEAGCVYFRKNATWLFDFESELLSFPKAEHDDQTDAFAYIAQMAQSVSNFVPISSAISRNY